MAYGRMVARPCGGLVSAELLELGEKDKLGEKDVRGEGEPMSVWGWVRKRAAGGGGADGAPGAGAAAPSAAPATGQAPSSRAGVVLACGGSATGALSASYRPLLEDVRRARPGVPVELAVVGEPGRLPDGREVRSVSQALDALARAGAVRAAVQPALVADGPELALLSAEAALARPGLEGVALGRPLVSRASDARRLAEVLCRALPRGRNAVTVLVGGDSSTGGGAHGAGVTGAGAASAGALRLLEVALQGRGRPDLWVCPLGADPTDLLRRVAEEAPCAFTVRLVPLMMAPGGLELSRIGAEEGEGLRAALERSLYGVEVAGDGLVSLAGVRALLLEHLDEALRGLGGGVPGGAPEAGAATPGAKTCE